MRPASTHFVGRGIDEDPTTVTTAAVQRDRRAPHRRRSPWGNRARIRIRSHHLSACAQLGRRHAGDAQIFTRCASHHEALTQRGAPAAGRWVAIPLRVVVGAIRYKPRANVGAARVRSRPREFADQEGWRFSHHIDQRAGRCADHMMEECVGAEVEMVKSRLPRSGCRQRLVGVRA